MASAASAKRPVTDSSCDGGGKRSKASYVSNKHSGRITQLGPNMRGMLITCDVHMEKAAIGETFRLLDELIGGRSTRADESTSVMACSVTAGESLAAELAALHEEQRRLPHRVRHRLGSRTSQDLMVRAGGWKNEPGNRVKHLMV